MFCFKLLLFVLTATMLLAASDDVWEPVRKSAYVRVDVRDINLSKAQRMAILRLIHSTSPSTCSDADATAPWTGNVNFSSISLAPSARAVLVNAGQGCARGGQGANGAIWLIRWDGSKPVLLASPETGLYGFLYALGRSGSYGYRDVIIGGHLSATENTLACFRFDGKVYVKIASAVQRRDLNSDTVTITGN
jgi:hypothetical protein